MGKNMENIKGVYKQQGALPGKTVAIFCGVHGNERVGIRAVQNALKNIRVKRGVVYFVEANPLAIEKNLRLINKNLNRCFLKGNNGDTEEDARARELMTLLDSCDALLDIHSSNSKDTTPFIICEPDALEIVKFFEFPIISFGWDAIEPGGADGYMFRNNKIGICAECGSVSDPDSNLPIAEQAIKIFLSHFDMLEENLVLNSFPHRFIKAHTVGHKKTNDLVFTKDYKDFALLEDGEIFAKDGESEHRAEKDDCIIFPRPNAPMGGEAFILGKEIPSPNTF